MKIIQLLRISVRNEGCDNNGWRSLEFRITKTDQQGRAAVMFTVLLKSALMIKIYFWQTIETIIQQK